jgi:hypothetical protein
MIFPPFSAYLIWFVGKYIKRNEHYSFYILFFVLPFRKKNAQNPVSAMFVLQCILINEKNTFIFGIKHHLIYSFTCYNKLFLISN